ncbi:YgfZ/GcvT domain-containing protein [Microvirga solisilvae]|uniref:CAF17-like 4Fe-4S cluster assembly/insertion protein YgfZ n=1 Tax=Microvirga solisilvae TaxID=2919498 RepID=UPI001FAFD10D|nr:folate-binding protein [Microvirga solisilvae]
MPSVHLADRGVVRVSGEDAKSFLDGLVTCDLDRVSAHNARLGALLSPQGKVLFDFIVFQAPDEIGGGYYLDTFRVFASDLAKRLAFYKLRAKVVVEDMSEAMAVVAGWEAPKPDDEVGLVTQDPRLPALGWRAIVAAQDAAEFATSPAEAYHAHRIRLGIPEAGRDFLLGDAFPHEALMDQLHGVDFDKGCYVGQEVVSRMQHRGTARTRLVLALYEGGFAADVGVDVTAGEKTLGKTGSGADGYGLIMIRLDRAADALAAGQPILAGGIPVKLEKPAWVNFYYPGESDIQSTTAPS